MDIAYLLIAATLWAATAGLAWGCAALQTRQVPR
jgi:hypothetical protein